MTRLTDPVPPGAGLAPHAAALLRTLWAAPGPASLQGSDLRLADVNDAFAALLGVPRLALTGRDPIDLEPLPDRDASLAERRDNLSAAAGGEPLPVVQRRLVDGRGQERWVRASTVNLALAGGRPLWLTLWQDISPEVAAREQARLAQDELAQWFDLSGMGMLVYDATGLIVRCNAAFEDLVEQVPEVLADAAPALQALLGWEGNAMAPALVPGARPLEYQTVLPLAGKRSRRLSARLVCQATRAGDRRVMAVLQDRSAEDARDLAQLEIGMLMDTASIGVATYDPGRGWLAPQAAAAPVAASEGATARPPSPAAASSGAMLGIGRDLVEAASLPEFERLQRALRSGERAEVRYAVRHPQLGPRWLLTRVEPGALAGGRSTTSVVTLDVTDQERAQRRNEQLLRELTTILDSSTAGIAYLRGAVLARCNWRFERMLGFEPGAAAGASLAEIFSRSGSSLQGAPDAAAALQALAQGRPFEAEMPFVAANGHAQWYSLSLRGAQTDGDQLEAVAVLTDITRLKTQQAELEQLLRDRELMFSLSEVGIVYQRGARIERANQAMAALTGWAAPELATLDAVELYEDTRACVDFEARIGDALRQQGRFGGERQLKRRGGGLVWVQVAVRPVNTDVPAAGLICSFVDIDERVRAREALALQAERTRAILNSVLVGIVTVSEHGIQWMNHSARRMFAGELADFVGEPISIVATPEADHPLRHTDLLGRLQSGQTDTFECRLKGRDGREFWVVGNAVLTGQSAGGGRELTIALLDIERRRQAEVSIAQAQASLQRVIETAPLAIALFDARTLRVQQLNQTAASFFGRPLPLVLGASLQDSLPAAKAEALRGWLVDTAAGGQAQQHEWRDDGDDGGADADATDSVAAARTDGSAAGEPRDGSAAGAPKDGSAQADGKDAAGSAAARVWDCRISALDDGDASGAGGAQLLLVASDVTEQRAAERARLQAAIAQREVLVREVHHRIKNNLQGVAGLLQQNAARNPALATVLSEAVGQVQAIAQVYGLQVGAGGPLQLASLLRAIASSVQRTFGRNIAVVVDADVPHLLPETEAIPVALTVNELFTNAIKHGSQPADGAGPGNSGGDGDANADGPGNSNSNGNSVRCRLSAHGDAVRICITAAGRLAAGVDVAQVRGGVSGLGLVRALLPRRSATLSLQQDGDDVVATVELRPPSVRLPRPALPAQEPGAAG